MELQLEQPMSVGESVEVEPELVSASTEAESRQEEPKVVEASLPEVMEPSLVVTEEEATIQQEAPISSTQTAHSTAQEQAWQQIAALSTTVNRLVEQLAQERTELLKSGSAKPPVGSSRQVGRTTASTAKSQEAAPVAAAVASGSEAELPRAVRTTENAEAKVNAAINAVVAYNNAPGRTQQDKWAFGVAQLKRLTRANQKVIERVVEHRKGEIEQQHHQHELGPNHNIRKGRQGIRIEDTVRFEWE